MALLCMLALNSREKVKKKKKVKFSFGAGGGQGKEKKNQNRQTVLLPLKFWSYDKVSTTNS